MSNKVVGYLTRTVGTSTIFAVTSGTITFLAGRTLTCARFVRFHDSKILMLYLLDPLNIKKTQNKIIFFITPTKVTT